MGCPGFERWGDMEKAMALYEEMHAAGLAQKPYGSASYLEQFSKKLQRTVVSIPYGYPPLLVCMLCKHIRCSSKTSLI